MKHIYLLTILFVLSGCNFGQAPGSVKSNKNSNSSVVTTTTTSSTSSTSSSSSSSSSSTSSSSTSSSTTTTLVGNLTDLDKRRCAALKVVEQRFPAQAVPNRPDLMKLSCNDCIRFYLGKTLALRSLARTCGSSQQLNQTADALLRYVYTVLTPAQVDCKKVLGAWDHTTHGQVVKEYAWFKNTMASDVRTLVENRLQCALLGLGDLSENLRWTANSNRLLVHELLGETARPTYRELKTWVTDKLKVHLNGGFTEWGSNYSNISIQNILNLSDLAQDADIRQLARGVADLYFSLQSTQSVNGHFSVGRIRTYKSSWSRAEPEQDSALKLLLDSVDSNDWYGYSTLSPMVVTTQYSPLTATKDLYFNKTSYEANHLAGKRHHYFYRVGSTAIGSIQNTKRNYYRTDLDTHDVFPITVRGKDDGAFIVPFGLPINNERPPKEIAEDERSVALETVAFIQQGGKTKGVWTGGGSPAVPIRLLLGVGISEFNIQEGWAFVRAGDSYFAWAPTKGDPLDANERSAGQSKGKFLRSSYEGADGETAVIEFSDKVLDGSFENFKREVLTRNPRPRISGELIRYRDRKNRWLEFAPDHFSVDGRDVNVFQSPFNESPVMSGTTIKLGAPVTINQNTGAVTGRVDRLPASLRFNP